MRYSKLSITQALDATKQRLQALRKRLKRYTREE